MNWISTLFQNFSELFKFLFVLEPWEQGLRVRAGKHVKKFHGGLHFKIPIVDVIYKQNVRTRIAGIKAQNVTTRDGKTITAAGAIEYKIVDVLPLYEKLHNAEDTICQNVQAVLSAYITVRDLEQCKPEDIMKHVTETMDLERWGLDSGRFLLTDFVVVKTYRIITGEIYKWLDSRLDTEYSSKSGHNGL